MNKADFKKRLAQGRDAYEVTRGAISGEKPMFDVDAITQDYMANLLEDEFGSNYTSNGLDEEVEAADNITAEDVATASNWAGKAVSGVASSTYDWFKKLPARTTDAAQAVVDHVTADEPFAKEPFKVFKDTVSNYNRNVLLPLAVTTVSLGLDVRGKKLLDKGLHKGAGIALKTGGVSTAKAAINVGKTVSSATDKLMKLPRKYLLANLAGTTVGNYRDAIAENDVSTPLGAGKAAWEGTRNSVYGILPLYDAGEMLSDERFRQLLAEHPEEAVPKLGFSLMQDVGDVKAIGNTVAVKQARFKYAKAFAKNKAELTAKMRKLADLDKQIEEYVAKRTADAEAKDDTDLKAERVSERKTVEEEAQRATEDNIHEEIKEEREQVSNDIQALKSKMDADALEHMQTRSFEEMVYETKDVKDLLKPDDYSNIKESRVAKVLTGDYTVSKPDVPIKDVTRRGLAKLLDEFTSIRVGNFKPSMAKYKNVDGYYNTAFKSIRIRKYGEFRTYMHEIGHLIDHMFDIEGADAELYEYAKHRWGENLYAKEQMRGEGIAEYMVIRTLRPDKVAELFPEYHALFERTLQEKNPKLLDKINYASNYARTLYNLEGAQAVRASIVFGTDLKDANTVKEKLTQFMDVLKFELADDLHALEKARFDIERDLGRPLTDAENFEFKARLIEGQSKMQIEMLLNADRSVGDVNALFNALEEALGMAPKSLNRVTMSDIMLSLNQETLLAKYPDLLQKYGAKDVHQAFTVYITALAMLDRARVKSAYNISQVEEQINGIILRMNKLYIRRPKSQTASEIGNEGAKMLEDSRAKIAQLQEQTKDASKIATQLTKAGDELFTAQDELKRLKMEADKNDAASPHIEEAKKAVETAKYKVNALQKKANEARHVDSSLKRAQKELIEAQDNVDALRAEAANNKQANKTDSRLDKAQKLLDTARERVRTIQDVAKANGDIRRDITKANAEYKKAIKALNSVYRSVDPKISKALDKLGEIEGMIVSLKKKDKEIGKQSWQLERARRKYAKALAKLITIADRPVAKALKKYQKLLDATYERLKEVRKDPYDLPTDIEDYKMTVANAPTEFKRASQLANLYNQNLLKMAEQAGLLEKDKARHFAALYPNYMPLLRDFTLETGVHSLDGMGGVFVKDSIIGEAVQEGSTRDVQEPLPNVIRNTSRIIRAIHLNNTMKTLVTLARDTGHGRLAEEVSHANETTFAVWENGAKKIYQTTPEMYQAFNTFTPSEVNIFKTMLLNINKAFRLSATTHPSFVVFNLMRDSISSFIASNKDAIGSNPLSTYANAFNMMLSKDPAKKAMYYRYMLSGVPYANIHRYDMETLSNTVEGMYPSKQTKAYKRGGQKALKAIRSFNRLGESVETAPRLSEFEHVYNKTGSTLKAAMAAKNVTLDFARGGRTMKVVNRYFIPFSNAIVRGAMQPFNVMFRGDSSFSKEMSRHNFNTTALSKVALLCTMTYLMSTYNANDEDYQGLDVNEKNRYWYLHKFDDGTWFRLPKPEGYSTVFINPMEYMADRVNGNETRSVKEFLKDNFSPSINLIPQFVKPTYEMQINFDTFRNRAIVTKDIQNDTFPEYEYTLKTNTFCKTLGAFFGCSPTKVEYAIKAYTCGWGTLGLDTMDYLMRNSNEALPEKRWTQYYLINRAFATPDVNTRNMKEVYRVGSVANDLLKLDGNKDRKKEYKLGLAIKDDKGVKDANNRMYNINKEIKETLTSSKLTGTQKTSKLERLYDARDKIAVQYNSRVRAISTVYANRYGIDVDLGSNVFVPKNKRTGAWCKPNYKPKEVTKRVRAEKKKKK